MSKPSTPPRPSNVAVGTLFVTSAALVGLAIYQWLELIEARNGKTPACAINETFNCTKVWDSPLAHRIHEYLGIPVAGMGVLWGVVAFTLSFLFLQRVRSTGDGSTFLGALKVWAFGGLLACVMFATASFQAKAVCLTCLGTYALTIGFAIAAMGMLGGPALPPGNEFLPGLGWSFALAAPVYFGLLYPGQHTPAKPAGEAMVKKLDAHDPNDFGALLATLPERDKLATSWARDQFKKSQPKDTSMFPVHLRKGDEKAPVRMVEFSDVLCGHCAQFETLHHELERMAPPGTLSFEPRYYPLDGECNPDIPSKSGNGVRCYGAKLQICAEKSPQFWKIREELFANQHQLDLGVMLSIATRHGLDGASLNECIKSPETASRLAEDIAYAKLHGIEGTPMVLVNGRVAPAVAPFIVGLVLAKADADAAYFQTLPPPPVE